MTDQAQWPKEGPMCPKMCLIFCSSHSLSVYPNSFLTRTETLLWASTVADKLWLKWKGTRRENLDLNVYIKYSSNFCLVASVDICLAELIKILSLPAQIISVMYFAVCLTICCLVNFFVQKCWIIVTFFSLISCPFTYRGRRDWSYALSSDRQGNCS